MGRAREDDRRESLSTYGVLGGAGPDLVDLVALALQVTGATAACIGFLSGRQMVAAAALGRDVADLSRADALSISVVESGEDLVLPDVAAAVVGGVRAYVGVPLAGRDGLAIGAVAVTDAVVRPFAPEILASLHTIARQVVAQLELSRLDSWSGRSGPGSTFDPVRLREALDEGELLPHFQPVVDLRTGRAVGFEALLRWEHPDLGLLVPGRFLPTIEATGLMLPVGRHVLAEALGALSVLRRAGPDLADLRMAVNASPAELIQPEFATTVLDELAMHGLRPQALVVEITETVAFVDAPSAVRQLTELREEGVKIALDDYGAGHSSLLRLLALPLSVLKLDRELTAGVANDHRARAVMRSTIAMAEDLGLTVVAEGVERADQRDALLLLGCQLGQGWLFGRPVPSDQMAGAARGRRVPEQATGPRTEPSDRLAGGRTARRPGGTDLTRGWSGTRASG